MSRRVSRTRDLRTAEESAHALAELRKQGLGTPDKPDSEIPQVPEGLTEIGDEQLMEHFAEMTAWSGYLAVQVACAQIDERTVDRVLELAEAQALISNWGGGSGDRVTVAKAQRSLDPYVQHQRERQAETHAYRKLVEVLAANVDRDAALISRELTRRTSTAPVNRRAERWKP
jgi:hypothetical protein